MVGGLIQRSYTFTLSPDLALGFLPFHSLVKDKWSEVSRSEVKYKSYRCSIDCTIVLARCLYYVWIRVVLQAKLPQRKKKWYTSVPFDTNNTIFSIHEIILVCTFAGISAVNEQFMQLCQRSEEVMDNCVLAETDENFVSAINFCNSSIGINALFLHFSYTYAHFIKWFILQFLCPRIEWSGAYCFCPLCLSVCLFVCLSVCLLSTLTFAITFEP